MIRLRPSRVLLVDDGESNRQLIPSLLARAGVDVAEAANGAKRSTYRRGSFDVILMDMQMPVMDGYEATRPTPRNGAPMPIAAMTANVMEGDEDDAMTPGAATS